MKNNHGGVIVLVKLQAKALLITLFLQVLRIFKLHTKHQNMTSEVVFKEEIDQSVYKAFIILFEVLQNSSFSRQSYFSCLNQKQY